MSKEQELEKRCTELRLLGAGWAAWELNCCPRCRSENVRGRTGPGLAMIACLDCRHIIGTFDADHPQVEVVAEWNGASVEAERVREVGDAAKLVVEMRDVRVQHTRRRLGLPPAAAGARE